MGIVPAGSPMSFYEYTWWLARCSWQPMPAVRQEINFSKLTYFSSRGGMNGSPAFNRIEDAHNKWYTPALEEDEDFIKQAEEFYNGQNNGTDSP